MSPFWRCVGIPRQWLISNRAAEESGCPKSMTALRWARASPGRAAMLMLQTRHEKRTVTISDDRFRRL